MSVRIRITVENIEEILETFNQIRLYRATTVEGSYVQIETEDLEEDTFYYTIEDASGSLNHWYRYEYYHTVSTDVSDQTNPFQVDTIDRAKVRQFAIEEYGAGMLLVAAAGGDTNTVKTDDYRIKSGLWQANRLKGSYILPLETSLAGQARQVDSTDPSSGTFNYAPVHASAITASEFFELHWLTTPYEWNLAINRGLDRYNYPSRVPIQGDGTGEQSLSFLPWFKTDRQTIGLWGKPSGYNHDIAWGSRGRWWGIRQDEDALYLMTNSVLGTSETAYFEANRTADRIYTDDSVLPPIIELRVIAALAYDEVLAERSKKKPGVPEDQRLMAVASRQAHQRRLAEYTKLFSPRPRYQQPQLAEPSGVTQPWRAR